MAQIEYTTFEELEDKYIGEVGTPRRDAYEAALKEEIYAYHIGVGLNWLFGKSLYQNKSWINPELSHQ